MSPKPLPAAFVQAMPALFVFLWSTGFIGAVWGLPYAGPMTFLAVRFLLTLVLLLPLALLTGTRWPGRRGLIASAVTGLLMHAGYLGGCFVAMAHGLPAAIPALIVCLQPLLTATLVGPLLGERVTRLQVAGLVLGLGGGGLVLSERLVAAGAGLLAGFDLPAIGGAVLALLAMSGGLVFQKRHGGGVDLWAGAFIQYAAAAAVLLPLAMVFEGMAVEVTGGFVFALVWLILALSIGAISLLMLLIRAGEAGRVASYFYLVPPVTALIAWPLFGDRLSWLQVAGMAVAVVGVALVTAWDGRAARRAAAA